MYTDAFAAAIMLVLMIIFLVMTYQTVGGLTAGHQALTDMKHLVPQELADQGHQGWTSMPEFGSTMWWSLVTTSILGVGIGAMAQPQLAMRSMTVKNNNALYRSVLVGGVFIFFMTGAIYMIGPLSNVIFHDIQGALSLDVAGGNVDLVVPMLINQIMPEWFVYLFTLTILSAVISTISSLIHVQATSFSEDIFKKVGITSVFGRKISLAQFGVIIGMIAAVILAYVMPGGVIAQATSFWFGICAAGFLPILIGGLFWKKGTRAGANASVVTGFGVSIFGFIFLHEKEAAAFGISNALFGKTTLLDFPMTHVDPMIYGLTLSALVFVIVSLATYKKQGQINDQTGSTDAIAK